MDSVRLVFLVFIFLLLNMIVGSCKRGLVYDKNLTIDKEGWSQYRKAQFEVSINDTIADNQLFINIRHNENYRYSNLYIFLGTHFPNGNFSRDTLEFILAEPFGKWLGKGHGFYKDHQILLHPALRFPMKGTYIFELEQAMRVQDLTGITAIGLRIQAAH